MSENIVDVSGEWSIRPDPSAAGVRERWWAGEWTDARAIDVPSAWQHVLGTGFHGVAWYRRVVPIPAAWLADDRAGLHRYWVRFESVATDATVWVNGVEVGRHVGDYLPFQFEITEAARAAAGRRELEIVVRVDEIHAPRPAPGVLVENGHLTKGFHDVLSLQHGGIWGEVSLRRSGLATVIPNGIRIQGDPASQAVRLRVEFDGDPVGAHVAFSILDAVGEGCAGGVIDGLAATDRVVDRGFGVVSRDEVSIWSDGSRDPDTLNISLGAEDDEARRTLEEVHRIRPWTPETPSLCTLLLDVVSETDGVKFVETHRIRFGFRTVKTGGPDNRTILLNGKPLCIRGVLHWGHEPRHIAPAPPPDQVRAEFARLKEMGFNCVCLCMVYMPDYYYDIADEMGMLVWQEHPIWKSPMEDVHLPEYRRLCEGFFRRDRNHPSVVIVSGSCEHERIHPELAAWWWKRAKEELPDRLVQVQTAFMAWTNPHQTDLHDEHVYESSGRWARFLEDLQPTLAELPPKPFVMGETVIGNSWPDVEKSGNRGQGSGVRGPEPALGARAWWVCRGVDNYIAYETTIADRYGPDTLARFKATADRQNLALRKFQSELFRTHPGNAGWVMNQIRDVPQGRLGFMDDWDRWRFTPEQTRGWLAPAPLLLWTPDHRRGFFGGRDIECRVGVSNFGVEPVEGPVTLRLRGQNVEHTITTRPLRCGLGDVQSVPVTVPLPRVARPMLLRLEASAPGLIDNAWDLWVLPEVADAPASVARLEGLPFAAKDSELEFEERSYSAGWGMKARSWAACLPDPTNILFKAPLWRFDAPMPHGTRVVLAHKLTNGLVDFMERGGRVVLLASKTAGGLGTRFVVLYGQCPLVIERGPLGPGDGGWASDLLHYDLTRRVARAIPVEDLGIADRVQPVIRLVFTHDRGLPTEMDVCFAAAVGRGLLIASSLDHHDDSGRYLLHRLLQSADRPAPECAGRLDAAEVRRWTVESAGSW